MYAAIVLLEMTEFTSAAKGTQLGRALSSFASSQPGFLTFVAVDTGARETTAVYIFEDRQSLNAAYDQIVQWHATHGDEWACSVKSVGSGQIVAQKGL